VLAALVELVSVLVYDRRRLTIEGARDLKEAAEMHRRIHVAIREKDAPLARREMEHHLDTARLNQLLEGEEPGLSRASGRGGAPVGAHGKGRGPTVGRRARPSEVRRSGA
jgi:hypothetical protein